MQQVQPGSPSKKSRARVELKKYNNTTYNNNIIIIILEVAVADTSEASLWFPLRPYTYWLKRGARDFLKREGYPAASAAPASPAGVIPKKRYLATLSQNVVGGVRDVAHHLATKCGGCSWAAPAAPAMGVDLRTIFHARMLCWCVLTRTSHPCYSPAPCVSCWPVLAFKRRLGHLGILNVFVCPPLRSLFRNVRPSTRLLS